MVSANSHFSPDVAEPTELQRQRIQSAWASAMDAGLPRNIRSQGSLKDSKATIQKALALEPGNALTNYYYGYGWHNLSPADRLKFGTAQQAKAALQKAVKVGNASVKTGGAESFEERRVKCMEQERPVPGEAGRFACLGCVSELHAEAGGGVVVGRGCGGGLLALAGKAQAEAVAEGLREAGGVGGREGN